VVEWNGKTGGYGRFGCTELNRKRVRLINNWVFSKQIWDVGTNDGTTL
jgi:hypothetical protein